MNSYRSSIIVYATQLDEDQTIVTDTGPVRCNRGDFLVYSDGSTHVVDEATFKSGYELINTDVSSTSYANTETINDGPDGNSVFTPVGSKVDVVVEYMKEHPSEVARIQAVEKQGAGRNGIMNYAGEGSVENN